MWHGRPAHQPKTLPNAVNSRTRERHASASVWAYGRDARATLRRLCSVPLDKPVIRDIRNANSGQLVIRCSTVANAKCYEGRCALVGPDGAPGPWGSAVPAPSRKGFAREGQAPPLPLFNAENQPTSVCSPFLLLLPYPIQPLHLRIFSWSRFEFTCYKTVP